MNLRDLAISGRTTQSQVIQQSGGMTVRLQDKDVTENGNVIADAGYDGLSRVGVNVSGGTSSLEDNKTVSITQNGTVEITPSDTYDGMKKVTATVNVSGGGGDVPTEWYLWQDKHGGYVYLPFAIAPDTLVDSMQYITIGSSFIINSTFLSTMKVTTYTKISESSFSIGRASYDRITEDVPIGGGQKYYVYGGYNSQVGTGDYDVLAITKEPLSVNGGTTEIAYCRQEGFSDLVRTDFKELTYEFHLDSSECTFSSVTFTDGSDTLRCSVDIVKDSGDPSDVTIIPNFTLN